MPWVSKEQIEKAKEVAVLDYVLAHEPDNVRRIGNEYRLKDHCITMSNGKWHWQSHGVGGAKATALNYLITVRGYGFVDAVLHLTGGAVQERDITPKSRPPPERKGFALPPRNDSNSRVIAYLQSRGIAKPLILDCIERGFIFESARYHNCVFVGRDDSGKARYASLRGTLGSFKRDADGSDKQFGFSLPPSNLGSDTVAVFESPIDALSHKMLCPDFDGWRLSLGGTATVALTNFFDRHSEVSHAIVCTDNDDAGRRAAAGIESAFSQIATTRALPPADCNDWNEALLAIQKAERTKYKDRGDDFCKNR